VDGAPTVTPAFSIQAARLEEAQEICARLQRFNRETGGLSFEPLWLCARDPAGALLGGVVADLYLGWLAVEALWVDEAARGQGLGQALLAQAEAQALTLGAQAVVLDRFAWQAQRFYERRGYRVFAHLEDFPAGQPRLFLHKRLQSPPPSQAHSEPEAAIQISPALPADGPALRQMLELYQHDLSDIWDQDLDQQGCFGYALPGETAERGRRAYLLRVKGRYAGFALLSHRLKVAGAGRSGQAEQKGCWMEQFFILKKYRHQGLGQQLARAVFAAHPGYWELGQMLNNRAAQAFWRALIGELTRGRYVEHELRGGAWEGFVQCFDYS